jgi:hypothetical protein
LVGIPLLTAFGDLESEILKIKCRGERQMWEMAIREVENAAVVAEEVDAREVYEQWALLLRCFQEICELEM